MVTPVLSVYFIARRKRIVSLLYIKVQGINSFWNLVVVVVVIVVVAVVVVIYKGHVFHS